MVASVYIYVVRRVQLPIDQNLDSIFTQIRTQSCVIILAEPGAGKSTRVPALAFQGQKKWVLLQPRRWAARSVAQRIANENHFTLGQEVGFQVRGESKVSSQTKLIVMTEGVMVQRLIHEPDLPEFEGIILDEFHERSLDLDFTLALLKEIQATLRPDLKIVIMSATLDPKPLMDFLPDAKLIQVKGKVFPVALHYRENESLTTVLDEALRAVPEGDILIFLPGAKEIENAAREIYSWLKPHQNIEVLKLYSSLPENEQRKVFEEATLSRRIVLSTNICETSITLPKIRVVIDQGLAKVMRTDTQMGQERLETVRISLASAVQRAGRAGRVAEGICYRLWSEKEQTQLRLQETPEVHRVSLSSVLFALTGMGVRNFEKFDWFEKPSRSALEFWKQELIQLGFLTQEGVQTEEGQRVSSLSLHPKASKLLLLGIKNKSIFHWVIRYLLWKESDELKVFSNSKISDLEAWIKSLNQVQYSKNLKQNIAFINSNFKKLNPLDLHTLLPTLASCHESEWDAFLEALFLSEPHSFFVGGKKVGGRQVVSLKEAFPLPDFGFILDSHEFRDSQGKLKIRVLHFVPISKEWILKHTTLQRQVLEDETSQRVRAYEGQHFLGLPLGTLHEAQPNEEELKKFWSAKLLRAKLQSIESFFEQFQQNRSWLNRLRYWNKKKPDSHLQPDWSLLVETYSFNKVKVSDWEEVVLETFFYSITQTLDQELPSMVVVPTGSQIKVSYEGEVPKISVRLQEVFGWLQSPAVMSGQVPILIELLSPGFKPIQLTQDLKSFWSGAYFEVRKELRARYPKHSWPEDPLNARPEAKGRHKVK